MESLPMEKSEKLTMILFLYRTGKKVEILDKIRNENVARFIFFQNLSRVAKESENEDFLEKFTTTDIMINFLNREDIYTVKNNFFDI